jgi:hypothetical protein
MSEIGKVALIGQTKVIGADYGDVANPQTPANHRILGLEIHFQNAYGVNEELGLIPLDIVDVGALGSNLPRGRLRIIVHHNAGRSEGVIQL